MCDFISGYKLSDGTLHFHSDADVEAAWERAGKTEPINWADMVGHSGYRFCFGQPAGAGEIEGLEYVGKVDLRKYRKLMLAAGYKAIYVEHGQVHRTDGPAIVRVSGNRYWYENNTVHRIDGPAVELVDGGKEWYKNGKLHRIGGPAIEWADGTNHWYDNGKQHRPDGSAIKQTNGNNYWSKNGKRHRIGGPAVEWSNGMDHWYETGICEPS